MMLTFLSQNLSTIVVALVLIAVCAAIVVYLVRSKKQGRSTCGGTCAHCAMHGSCHSDGKK